MSDEPQVAQDGEPPEDALSVADVLAELERVRTLLHVLGADRVVAGASMPLAGASSGLAGQSFSALLAMSARAEEIAVQWMRVPLVIGVIFVWLGAITSLAALTGLVPEELDVHALWAGVALMVTGIASSTAVLGLVKAPPQGDRSSLRSPVRLP